MRISHSTVTGDEVHVHEIPSFGLGVFLMSEPGECKSACLAALNAGYTHIDTARAYSNEHEVGEALKESGVNREDVFITTKLRRMHAVGFDDVLEHCQGISATYWIPITSISILFMLPRKTWITGAPVWKGMEHCLEQGWVKAIESQIMVHSIWKACVNMRLTCLQSIKSKSIHGSSAPNCEPQRKPWVRKSWRIHHWQEDTSWTIPT